jgi:hypothetical protein
MYLEKREKKNHFGNTKATIGPKELKSFVLSFENVSNILNSNYL